MSDYTYGSQVSKQLNEEQNSNTIERNTVGKPSLPCTWGGCPGGRGAGGARGGLPGECAPLPTHDSSPPSQQRYYCSTPATGIACWTDLCVCTCVCVKVTNLVGENP